MRYKIVKFMIAVFFVLAGTQAGAQGIEMRPDSIRHNGAERPCLTVELDLRVEPEALLEAWEEFMDDRYDVDMEEEDLFGKDDLRTAKKVTINKVSSKTLDLYAYTGEMKAGLILKVFAAPGYDIYIGSQTHPESYRGMESIAREFMVAVLPGLYEKPVKMNLELLEELADEREDVQENIDDDRKDIEKLQEELREKTGKLDKLEQRIEATRAIMEANERKRDYVKQQLASF